MAESLVQVTEGAGKKLHTFQRTIGANAVEDEVVLFGENYLASYTFGTTVTTSMATANSHIVQIMAGASLKVRIRRIEVYQTAAATTGTLAQFSLQRLTSAGTGGSGWIANPLDTTDGAAGAAGMLLPTAKGTESTVLWGGSMYFIQTIGASTPFVGPGLVIDFDRPRSKPVIIPAGATNGICLKNITAVAGATVLVNVWIDETSF